MKILQDNSYSAGVVNDSEVYFGDLTNAHSNLQSRISILDAKSDEMPAATVILHVFEFSDASALV